VSEDEPQGERILDARDILYGGQERKLLADIAQKLGEIVDLLRGRTVIDPANVPSQKFVQSRSDYTDRDPAKAMKVLRGD
jgi:hypothetical protein